MHTTPNALRKHVVLCGPVNTGKSTLFNALTGQNNAIVANRPGTTTDPVRTAMELIPYGPIVLVDTAGLGDNTPLGAQREQKTTQALRRADAVLYVDSAAGFDAESYARFKAGKYPHLLVLTADRAPAENECAALQTAHPTAVWHLQNDPGTLDKLRTRLTALLSVQEPEDPTLLGDLLPAGSNVVMVVPVDTEAPKGRLILPQVQLIRDCLDHGIKCFVTREHELESALAALHPVHLVVTDSQAFHFVNEHIPAGMPLTSFSLLLARQKADLPTLLAGIDAIAALPDGANVLMLESCTHNHTHEDIGRMKIPALLHKKTGKHFHYTYHTGYDFPQDLSPYAFAVQCGGCMVNRREIVNRLAQMRAAHLPVTNYGVLLAWGNGILGRCAAFLTQGAPC